MQVPPFQRVNPTIPEAAYAANGSCDHTSQKGARRAAAIIERAWALAGHAVHVPIHEVKAKGGYIWAPDLSKFVGGLPPRE